ncbi:cyclic beta 1-2 glucan synthetase, partial [Candidatus Sumerlaeota bacterium]|nr:cyclic beta 1-2 glucan synthetase [Candidatus Sumerlaeota bacterium]
PHALVLVMGLLSLIAASQLATSVVNWLATLVIRPRPLPKLDFSRGIPADRAAIVVIPTMLGSAKECDALLEGLEVRFLANRDENLRFAILTDLTDAPQETMPGDDALAEQARRGIENLNEKYQSGSRSPFLLLHRPRRWNPREGIWMGWERKRGKLMELNALLRGKGENRFLHVVGDTSGFQAIKYVITLDTDTRLPRDSARQLVGTISHPLNEARYDPQRRRVCEGYAILQPRVAVSLPGANRSWYVRLFAGEAGIDPYTRSVSDVYQDLFQEGSFIGKGIYDVDAFDNALRERLPENTILSHDLLEGCFARSALVSDVQLYEEFPSQYSTDVSRKHRWIRGDWQIFPWLLPRAPGADAGFQANALSTLSRWKIFDNLRRSLVPGSLTLLLLFGWTVMNPGWFWPAFVVGITLLPLALESLVELLRKPPDIPLDVHLYATGRAGLLRLSQGAFTLLFLPYDAYYSLDAIIRTWLRMFYTRRRLLEWKTAHDSALGARTDIASFFRAMWISPVLALGVLGCMWTVESHELLRAAPLLALWAVSPAIAWWLSRPIPPSQDKLHPERIMFLRKLARKTWRFFETFVGPEDHWLPPDNYQELPVEAIAHRTSPTNMGLALLANLAAHDFGWLSADAMATRISSAFETMKRLDRYRGHFYNWYDTRTLQPLQPMYVSSVDSGNLAGYLLTLRPGLLELADKKILQPGAFTGLRDTLLIIADGIGGISGKFPFGGNGFDPSVILA